MKLKSNVKSYDSMTDPAVVKEICRGLRQMRLNRNMTQSELAERSGLNRVTISRMESGRAATLLTVVQVLRVLGKLEILDVFSEEAEISPLQLLKQQKKKRRRASGSGRKKTVEDIGKEESEW